MPSLIREHISVVKNFLIYSSGSLLLRGASIIIAPITMAMLTPEDYGLLALANSFVNLMAPIVGLGLRQLLAIEFFRHDADDQKKMINDILTLYLVLGTPLLILTAVAVNVAQGFFLSHQLHITFMLLVFIIIFCQFFVELFYQVLQYHHCAWRLTCLQLLVATINISTIIVGAWWLKCGAQSMLAATACGMWASLAIALYVYKKQNFFAYVHVQESIKKISYYLHLSIPLIPTILFSWLLASGSRWILAHYTNLHDVGIFAVADIFNQLFYTVILYPLNGAYIPYVFNQYTQNKEHIFAVEKQHQKVMWFIMGLLAVSTLSCYIITKPLLYYLFPAPYHAALVYVPYMLLSSIFLLGQACAATFIQHQKKNWFLAYALIIPACINGALTALLTPLLHLTGCVIASVTAYATFFALTLWYNWRLQKITYSCTEPTPLHIHASDAPVRQ